MTALRIAAWITLLAVAGVAAAGDVCFHDPGAQVFYKFDKWKAPKKNGDAVRVAGWALLNGAILAAPVDGTLTRDLVEGSLTLGLTLYGDRCLATAVLAEDLSGTISYDCNLDDMTDGSYALASISCGDL